MVMSWGLRASEGGGTPHSTASSVSLRGMEGACGEVVVVEVAALKVKYLAMSATSDERRAKRVAKEGLFVALERC